MARFAPAEGQQQQLKATSELTSKFPPAVVAHLYCEFLSVVVAGLGTFPIDVIIGCNVFFGMESAPKLGSRIQVGRREGKLACPHAFRPKGAILVLLRGCLVRKLKRVPTQTPLFQKRKKKPALAELQVWHPEDSFHFA